MRANQLTLLRGYNNEGVMVDSLELPRITNVITIFISPSRPRYLVAPSGVEPESEE